MTVAELDQHRCRLVTDQLACFLAACFAALSLSQDADTADDCRSRCTGALAAPGSVGRAHFRSTCRNSAGCRSRIYVAQAGCHGAQRSH